MSTAQLSAASVPLTDPVAGSWTLAVMVSALPSTDVGDVVPLVKYRVA